MSVNPMSFVSWSDICIGWFAFVSLFEYLAIRRGENLDHCYRLLCLIVLKYIQKCSSMC